MLIPALVHRPRPISSTNYFVLNVLAMLLAFAGLAPSDQLKSFGQVGSEAPQIEAQEFGSSAEGRPLSFYQIPAKADSAPSAAGSPIQVLVLNDPSSPLPNFDSSILNNLLQPAQPAVSIQRFEWFVASQLNPDRIGPDQKTGSVYNAQCISLANDWFKLDAVETRALVRLLNTAPIDRVLLVSRRVSDDVSAETADSELPTHFSKSLERYLQLRGLPLLSLKISGDTPTPSELDWKVICEQLAAPFLPVDSKRQEPSKPHSSYAFLPKEFSWAASRLYLQGIQMEEVTLEAADGLQHGTAYRFANVAIQPNPPTFEKATASISNTNAKGPSLELLSGKAIPAKTEQGWLIPADQPQSRLLHELLWPAAQVDSTSREEISLSDNSLSKNGYFFPDDKPGSTYPIIILSDRPKLKQSRMLHKLELKGGNVEAIRGERLSLEKLYSPSNKVTYFHTNKPLPRWVPNEPAYLSKRDGEWLRMKCSDEEVEGVAFEVSSGFAAALKKTSIFTSKEIQQFSNDLNLFDSSFATALFTHKNDLWFYQASTGKLSKLTDTPEQKKQVPIASPTGEHVSFVTANNLWIVDTDSHELKPLTSDGSEQVLNGILDWVYQEELYGRGNFQGNWFSQNGKYLAYLRLDQTKVPTFIVDDAIPFAQSIESIKYPKAGQPNPIATLHVIELETLISHEISLGDYSADDRLVVRVDWSDLSKDLLTYQVQNRIQSKLEAWVFDAATRGNRKLLQEESEAWVDVLDRPRELADGSWLWLSETDGNPAFRGHRSLFRIRPDGTREAVSKPGVELREVLWNDPNGTRVIATARYTSVLDHDLVEIDGNNGEMKQLGQGGGTHRASVHPKGDFILTDWSDIRQANETWLLDQAGAKRRLVEASGSDRREYVEMVEPELLTISARDGFSMQSILYRPANWEESVRDGKRLPVLIHVYAGPRAPSVQNRSTYRNDLWHRWLVDQGIAVLLCDNRSALGNGVQDSWMAYRDLGRIEMQDLEDAVGWLQQSEWADKERVGIWGWSYGGYFTAYAMTHSKLFRAGISGAPVTDWRNYDSIYTERFMSTPQLNPDGYRTSSVVEAASNLHGRMLLIHGELDENVHMTNTLQLSYALQKAGKPFELMIYLKNRHSITDPAQQEHQYRMMSDFLMRHLK